eukprot:scaffold35827_cov65-Phaeocystis_antarctica.AAC.2
MFCATKSTRDAPAAGWAAAALRRPASMTSFCELISSAILHTADALETSDRRRLSSSASRSEASRLSRAAWLSFRPPVELAPSERKLEIARLLDLDVTPRGSIAIEGMWH